MTKVLCIEDEADFREDVVEILRTEGYQTFEAADGEQGFELIEEENPDLILCDINMPKMSGFDLLRKVNNIYKDRRPSFIFLTAMGQKKDQLTGLNLNVDEYIIKPVDFDILLGKIRQRVHQQNQDRKGSPRITKPMDASSAEEEIAKALTVEIIETTQELEKALNLSKREKHIHHLLENIRSSSLKLNDLFHHTSLVSHEGEMLFSEEITNLFELLNSIALYISHHCAGTKVTVECPKEIHGVLIDHKYFSHALEKLLLVLARESSKGNEIHLQVSANKERQVELKVTASLRPDSSELRFFTGFATQIMELHGGAFQTKGSRKGATFAFTIPAYRVMP